MSARSLKLRMWPLNVPETSEIFVASNQSGHRYMEDTYTWEWEKDQQVYVGLFDGHGGREAAEYAADHLWTNIQCKGCDCRESDTVKKALVQGFRKTHEDMWTVRGK